MMEWLADHFDHTRLASSVSQLNVWPPENLTSGHPRSGFVPSATGLFGFSLLTLRLPPTCRCLTN